MKTIHNCPGQKHYERKSKRERSRINFEPIFEFSRRIDQKLPQKLIKKPVPFKTKLLHLRLFAVNHLHYPALLIKKFQQICQ